MRRRQDDAWAERAAPRRARLAGGTVLAAVSMVVAVIGLAALPHAPARAAVEEAPIEVALVERPEPEPEPTPPEPPPPDPSPPAPTLQVSPAPAPSPRAPRVEMPRAIPDAPPPESDVRDGAPSRSEAVAEGSEGPVAGGGTAQRGPVAPPPSPPRAPAPRPAAPVRVTDDVQPPRPIAMASPTYPAAARASGVEGTVLVAYVVDATGAVTDARVVRGPPELAPACLAAVRAWRFAPAVAGGRPVAVQRTARFPFRLRT